MYEIYVVARTVGFSTQKGNIGKWTEMEQTRREKQIAPLMRSLLL